MEVRAEAIAKDYRRGVEGAEKVKRFCTEKESQKRTPKKAGGRYKGKATADTKSKPPS
jgi:hypothetical protein